MKKLFMMLVFSALIPSLIFTASCKQRSSENHDSKSSKNIVIGKDCLEPDSVALQNLGKMAAKVIFNPDRVTAYSLKGYDTIPAGSVEVIPHFVRNRVLGTVDRKYSEVLKFLLYATADNYRLDSLKIRSPRIPLIELEYKKKKESVSVIFSFSDMTWSVKSDGKIQFVWNYGNKDLVARYFRPFLQILDNKK